MRTSRWNWCGTLWIVTSNRSSYPDEVNVWRTKLWPTVNWVDFTSCWWWTWKAASITNSQWTWWLRWSRGTSTASIRGTSKPWLDWTNSSKSNVGRRRKRGNFNAHRSGWSWNTSWTIWKRLRWSRPKSPHDLLLLLYSKHPSKREEKSTDSQMKTKLKMALLHYHPDKQDVEVHGLKWVYCID